MYKEVWEASHGEMLSCARETRNVFDPFAVCVKNMRVQWATCQETLLQSVLCSCGVAGLCGCVVGTGFNCALNLT